MQTIFNFLLTPGFYYSILRIATPIIFAALGALITARSGVVNIGLEGMMLFSALGGVLVSAWTGSVFAGLLGGILVSVAVSLIMSYATLVLQSHITLSGIAINMLASGATVSILFLVCNDKGISSSLSSGVLPKVVIPLLDRIPVLGEILSGHNILTYTAFFMVLAVWFILNKTTMGLRIRAVGENSEAALSVGIKPVKYQFIAMLISGVLAGLGGVYMSMGYVSWFSRDMLAGRGFIALAAQQLGQGTTVGTLIATLVFGAADALASNLQAMRLPSEIVQSIPYAVTIVGLVAFSILKRKHDEREMKKMLTEKIRQP